MNGFISAILWLVGGYGVLVLFVYVIQSHLLYFPSEAKIATPVHVGLTFESVTLTTEDSVKLDAWFVPAPGSRGAVLFFHGNAGNISHRLDTLLNFHRLGLSTLIFDYRGFGASEGTTSEEGTYRDAVAAWQYLSVTKNIPAHDIILFGRSLGGGIASHLATIHTPRALIIESSFTSIPDLAATLYPILPVRWISRFQYHSRNHLKQVNCPVLIIHSKDDEIIPFEHGRQLYQAAKEPKQFLRILGGHNDGFMRSKDFYLEAIDRFLKSFEGSISKG